jgi:PAS domain S-box-containing protein
MHIEESQLKLFLDTAHGGFYTVASDGTTLLCNKGFLTMLGFASEDDVIGRKLHDVIHGKHPDGSYYDVHDCPIYKCASQGIAAHVEDELFYHLNGTPVRVEYWVHPVLRDGAPNGAVCTFVDASDKSRAEALQAKLAHELAHRVKNTLAMVQAVVHQSLRNAQNVDVARNAISERLLALGNAHDLLATTGWLHAPITLLVESAITPHLGHGQRIKRAGPEIDVAARVALGLSMGLHELALNATKYGALSNEGGTVDLNWTVEGTGPDERFHMHWLETGGPKVSPPTRKGFGSRLIGRNFGADFGGKAVLTYESSGVEWHLEAPLSGIQQL